MSNAAESECLQDSQDSQDSTDLSISSESANCDKISQLAYQKWQEAGSPEGDGVEFWLAAEKELSASS